VGEKPGHAAVAIQERMDPRQAMMCGCSRDQTDRFGRHQRTVKLREALEEFPELLAGRCHVPAYAHLALAKVARLDFMGLSLFVLDLAEFLGQSPVESLVQPAKEFSCADIGSGHRRQPALHLRLNFHVSEMLDLKGPLSRVRRKVLPDRRVNVSRPWAMTLDEVRVVAVHRAHHLRHEFAGGGMQRRPEPLGAAYQRQGQGRRFTITLCSQERLHVRWAIVKPLDRCIPGHLCRCCCRSHKTHKAAVYKYIFEEWQHYLPI